MRKILVLNSLGPMASTLLAGLLEKLQFTNIPLRKIRLHQYLTGELSLDSGVMEARLAHTLKDHSHKTLSGGVSVLDRDNQKPRALADISRVQDRLGDIDHSSIQNLFFACRNLYCDAVIYKDIKSNRDWQIELTTDVQKYGGQELYNLYQSHFDDARVIHLHRPFEKWINSISSQAFVSPKLRNRLFFFPHFRYADYLRYEKVTTDMPGLHIHFDELFDTPIEDLATKMAEFLDVPPPSVNLRGEDFDMYGKSQPYTIAFKRFDDSVVFLQKSTIDYMSRHAKAGTLTNIVPAFISWILFLRDMSRFRRKSGRSFL